MCVCLITVLYNFAIFIFLVFSFALCCNVFTDIKTKTNRKEKDVCYIIICSSATVEIDIACIKGRNMGINVSRP